MTSHSALLILTTASALFLAGCEGTGQNQQSGAIVGGMVGGVLGASADDENRGSNAAFGTVACDSGRHDRRDAG